MPKTKVTTAPGRNAKQTTITSIDASPELKRNFLGMVRKTFDCWLFEGRISTSRIGQIRVQGKSTGAQGGTRTDASRLSYMMFIGDIPTGYLIDRLCRVSHCVRPDHLEAITHTELARRVEIRNARDKLRLANDKIKKDKKK